jgi:hypothetical protein
VARRARRARSGPHPRDRGPGQRLPGGQLDLRRRARQTAAGGQESLVTGSTGRAAQLDVDHRRGRAADHRRRSGNSPPASPPSRASPRRSSA